MTAGGRGRAKRAAGQGPVGEAPRGSLIRALQGGWRDFLAAPRTQFTVESGLQMADIPHHGGPVHAGSG